jgi:hypothetical protein
LAFVNFFDRIMPYLHYEVRSPHCSESEDRGGGGGIQRGRESNREMCWVRVRVGEEEGDQARKGNREGETRETGKEGPEESDSVRDEERGIGEMRGGKRALGRERARVRSKRKRQSAREK